LLYRAVNLVKIKNYMFRVFAKNYKILYIKKETAADFRSIKKVYKLASKYNQP